MSDFIIIDGKEYRVALVNLQRTANVLDKFANRTEDGVLHREVIGTFYNYQLEIGIVNDIALYDELFEVLAAPVESHIVELPHDHRPFEGYFASVQDKVRRLTPDGCLYTGLTCSLIASKPTRVA